MHRRKNPLHVAANDEVTFASSPGRQRRLFCRLQAGSLGDGMSRRLNGTSMSLTQRRQSRIFGDSPIDITCIEP